MYRLGDPSRFFDLLDEGVQVDTSKAQLLPDRPELIGGKEAALDLYRHYWGTWDDYVLEPVQLIEAGEDGVVVVQDERGTGRGSGTPFERRWAVLYTMREARIVRIEHFAKPRDALEAAGLSSRRCRRRNVEIVRRLCADPRGLTSATNELVAPEVDQRGLVALHVHALPLVSVLTGPVSAVGLWAP